MRDVSTKAVSLAEARKLLRRVVVVTDVYVHGCQWNQRTFFPALKVLAQSCSKSDRVIAATGYYVRGDVHDFNRAPLAAVRAYRHCVRLWPANGAAYREMGLLYDEMGQNAKGIRLLRKAVRVDPSDDLAVADLEMLEEGPMPRPPFRAGDPFWQSSELLATSKFSQALAVLDGKRSVRADLFRARVYGAMADAPRVLELWERIAKQKSRLEIQSADWFFLPPTVWHSADLWSCLLRVAPRVTDWFSLKGHESLQDTGISERERFELFLRYHSARTQPDPAAARELSRRHPQWTEAAILAKRLKAE
jgi:tetratricopeptide (TPR) repeat protein